MPDSVSITEDNLWVEAGKLGGAIFMLTTLVLFIILYVWALAIMGKIDEEGHQQRNLTWQSIHLAGN